MPGKSKPKPAAGVPRKQQGDVTRQYEKAIRDMDKGVYILRLYVAGSTPRSARAIANLKSICDEHLQGRYQLEVIDVYQQEGMAKSEQVIAAPTLIKKLPPPLRKLIGDMSDKEKILFGLNVKKKKGGS